MIDTVTLQPNKSVEIAESYLTRFRTVSKTDSLWKQVFNSRLKSDGYLPNLTIVKRKGVKDWFTERIDIQFSVPKILYGTNFFGVDENDYDEVVNKLTQRLNFIFKGFAINKELIKQSNLKNIAFVFNFILPMEFARPIEFLKIIPFLDIGKKYNRTKDTYYTEENEIGFCGRIFNKQVGWKMYDKGAEVLNNAKTIEEVKVASAIKTGLLPSKVIRMEITYQNRYSLKRHLATRTDKDNKRERHLYDVFNNKLCKSILSESFNKLTNIVNVQALDIPLFPINDCFKIIKRAGLNEYDAYALIGKSLLVKQAGSFQLKLINDVYFNRQARFRCEKRFKKILSLKSLPSFTLKKVVTECRKQLDEFKIKKPVN